MSNLTLNTVVYYGAGNTNGVAAWYDRSAGVSSGFSVADASLRLSTGKWRGLGRIRLPKIATDSTACACPGNILDESDAQFSFRIDPNASTATRLDLYLRFKDYVASSEVRAMFENLQFPTG